TSWASIPLSRNRLINATAGTLQSSRCAPAVGERAERIRIGRARDAERLGLLPASIGEEGRANELHIDYRCCPSRGNHRKPERENRKDFQSHEFTLQTYETSPTSLAHGPYHNDALCPRASTVTKRRYDSYGLSVFNRSVHQAFRGSTFGAPTAAIVQ